MDEFQLYFQPKVDVRHDRVVGYEVLLRNKEQNPYYPVGKMANILKNQEEHYYFLKWFQDEMTQVLHSAPTEKFAINFAPNQLLYPETHIFFTNMQQFVEQLIIEVTEEPPLFVDTINNLGALTVDQQLHSAFLSIKEKGYYIALDDVDSGKNSLDEVLKYTSYLDQIKFSIVKCDKKDLNEETLNLFLTAWKHFSEDYHLDFIVEGIEDQETSDRLKKQGIFIQQGYYFGKPSKKIKKCC
ncbi:EAL domain-containing protein [Carnobacterium sp.]|uniref:EAL domain-containing protein n=1 Tax=Carnobacterium sp. TaxID=48221 RepID=UPI00388FE82E